MVLETERLVLRKLSDEHAEFILELLNEPSFLKNIGDRGVRNVEGARRYIRQGPVASYERFGFGLFLTELRENHAPIGICGLLKRDHLEDVDLGFAFLPRFWGKGYAYESATATMVYGRENHHLRRIVAITAPENHSSIKLLEKIGFRFERLVRMPGEEEDIRLYAYEFQ